MFFTYLWRELRRRMRQAIFIAVGLALGIGLVITVTKAPTASSGGGGFGFGFRQSIGTRTRPKAGSKINNNTLTSEGTLASISSSAVTTVTKLQNVAAAAGGLTLTDRTVTGTVPALNFNNGSGGGFGGGGTSGGGNPSSFGA